MARSDAFDGLSEFLAITRRGSFRAAAIELDVTPGAVSQAVRSLERRLGLPLFHRTTRRVTLTEAGEQLLAQLGPASEVIVGALQDVTQFQARPSGTLRLLVQRLAVPDLLVPVLPVFRRRWPDIRLDVTIDDTHADLVAGGFDAGIRIGEYIDRDMVAVRVSRPFSWVVLGGPAYLDARGRPQVPEDLAHHECIRFRLPDRGTLYRWEFERDGHALAIDPPGSILVNDSALLRSLAVAGLGLIYTSDLQAEAEIAQGLLEPVLRSFAPADDSLFIYFPNASRSQPKLRAFVEACTSVRAG